MANWVTWSCEWSEKNKNGFYDKLMAEGKISQGNQQPNIEPFAFYRDAFSELSTCRNESSAIPFTSIVEYFKIYGEGEDFEDFIYVIRSMDNTLLEITAKKRESKNGSSRTNTSDKNKVRSPRR